MLIDARGLACPKPVTMAEEEISKIGEGIVEVLVDNEASVKNLTRFASKNSLYVETEKVDDYWRVKLVKGYPCETDNSEFRVQSSELEEKTGKDILLVVGTDIIGRDEELGRVLMKGFFETMMVTKELPHTIFFLNEGVKLTTLEEPVIEVLKEIEKLGIEIYSCSTCLKHYNLEDKLKVGQVGGMFILVEGIKDFKKVVWI
jgi:selenium metabolism protein YedF